jgi:two-component system response regulator RstA
VRGIEYNGLDRSIDLRIARLRKKLGDDGKQPQASNRFAARAT